MRVRKLLSDEDAVSPVIGVILMVAITVILAAVIASFVLGLGQQTGNVAPQASFSFDYNQGDNNLTITHDGGDPIPKDEVYLRGVDFGDKSGTTSTGGNWTDYAGTTSGSVEGKSAVVAGDRVILNDTSTTYEIDVVWESTQGTDSSTLASDSGPDA